VLSLLEEMEEDCDMTRKGEGVDEKQTYLIDDQFSTSR
jgi:hypothetical protein